MKRSAWLWVAVVGAALLFVGWTRERDVSAWFGVSESVQPFDMAAPASHGGASASREAARPRAASRSPAAGMVLPPPDVPLAPLLTTLAQGARRGDVGAMCRLSFELQRCRVDLEQSRRAVASLTESMGQPDSAFMRVDGKWVSPDRQALLATQRARRDKLEVICAGVAPLPGLEPWRLQLGAARAGQLSSMLRFATGRPFQTPDQLADLEGLRAYRDEAPGLLRRAVAMGDPRAAYLLMSAYAGNGFIAVTGRIPEDPGLALAYALALQGVGDVATEQTLAETTVKLRHRLNATEQRTAEQAAFALGLRYAAARGSSLDLRTGLKSSDGSECSEPVQSSAVSGPVAGDAPIAPEVD